MCKLLLICLIFININHSSFQQCKICNKSYVNRNHLLRHVKSVHGQADISIEQMDTFFDNVDAKEK